MEKTARELVEGIVRDGGGVYSTDAGCGSGGPLSLDSSGLQEMMDDDSIDEYEIVSEIWDDRNTVETIISDMLSSFAHPINDPTTWILAERIEWIDGCQNNPYRHYLLLWDVSA